MPACVLSSIAVMLLLAANLTGTWTGQMTDLEGGSGDAYLRLQQNGDAITGVTGAGKDHTWPIKNAVYTGDRLTFTAVSTDPESGAQSKWVFDLKVQGDSMEGTAEGSREGQTWKLNLKLAREK
jgi:hypothetical protein